MAHILGVERSDLAQADCLVTQMLEETHAVAEQDRRDMQKQFIYETGPQCLLARTWATDFDVFVFRERFCLGNRRLDAVSHEHEFRFTLR